MRQSTSTILSLSIAFLVSCAAEEVAVDTQQQEELEEVEDIPVPSQDREEEEEEEAPSQDEADEQETEQDIDEPALTVNYGFVDSESLLYVQVWKDESAWGSGLAHNHVMRATDWDGQVSYNEDDISKCSFGFTVPVYDLQVDEDAMREYVGYGDTISDSDRSQIREHMLADNQLDAARHSEITFESLSCDALDSETLLVTGDMTIAGNTAEISVEIDFEVVGNSFYAMGGFEFTHSDFGIEPYSAIGGMVRNSEDLEIHFDMVGTAE